MKRKVLLLFLCSSLLVGCGEVKGNKIETKKINLPKIKNFQIIEERIIEQNSLSEKYVCAENGLNIREFASKDSKSIAILPINSLIKVYKDFNVNGWVKIKYKNNDYYVFEKYLSENKVEIKKPIENNNSKYLGKYKITHYCGCKLCNGEWTGKPTKSGKMATVNRTVGCNSLPLGTKIVINGKDYIVEDTGNMKNNVIDVYVNNHKEALNKGTYWADVYKR